MLNFEKELEKLLSFETEPLPRTALEELALSETNLLSSINKTQNDVSMQIEEIYDIVSELDLTEIKGKLDNEIKRSKQLLEISISICDIIDDFCAYAYKSGSAELEHQAGLMLKNAGRLLDNCSITRTGKRGEALNPIMHSVKGTVYSDIPRECVAEVLQSGYCYMGNIVRKAAVILSMGVEDK